MARVQKTQNLYPHPFSKAYWRDAAAELRDTKMLVVAALMIAVRVAMKGLGIPLAPNLKINVAFFANALGAMIFGPVVATVAAVISDTLGCIIFPQGVYFFPYVFIEIAGSVIFALFLYRAKVTATRVILSRFCIDFFVNIVMNAPITALYYKLVLGKSYIWFQLPHILKNLCMFPVEAILLTMFLAVMIPIASRLGLVYFSGKDLKMNKKQIALMAALVIVGGCATGGYLVYNYNSSNQASWLDAQEKTALNTALTEDARSQGLIGDDVILIVKSVDKELGQEEVGIEFLAYQLGEGADVDAMWAYRSTDANKDQNLTQTGSGSAVVNKDDLTAVSGLQLELDDGQ